MLNFRPFWPFNAGYSAETGRLNVRNIFSPPDVEIRGNIWKYREIPGIWAQISLCGSAPLRQFHTPHSEFCIQGAPPLTNRANADFCGLSAFFHRHFLHFADFQPLASQKPRRRSHLIPMVRNSRSAAVSDWPCASTRSAAATSVQYSVQLAVFRQANFEP